MLQSHQKKVCIVDNDRTYRYILTDGIITHCYHIDGDKVPKNDSLTIHKDSICAIVVHPEQDQVLVAFWKTCDWIIWPGGGIEPNEHPIQTICREIQEETGYDDMISIQLYGNPINKYYYHPTKHINIKGTDRLAIIHLGSLNHKPISQIEHAKHEMKWVNRDEVVNILNSAFHKLFWYRYLHIDKPLLEADKEFLSYISNTHTNS